MVLHTYREIKNRDDKVQGEIKKEQQNLSIAALSIETTKKSLDTKVKELARKLLAMKKICGDDSFASVLLNCTDHLAECRT